MSAPRLSIALATYNGARYLGEQLDSFARQTRLPDELVVCDDASTDETRAIVRRFVGRASFDVRFEINGTRLGSNGNFARALSLCSGDVLFLSDQDDVWLPQKLATLESALARRPEALVAFGDTQLVDQDLLPLGYTGFDSLGLRGGLFAEVTAGGALDVLLRFNVVTGASMAFRAELRELALPIGQGWVHDEWIAAVGALFGPVAVVDEPLILYRQHARQQIGLRRLGPWAMARRAWKMGEPYMAQALERAEALRERAASARRPLHRAGALALVDAKCEHVRRRLAMRRGAPRPTEVAKALLHGDYSRFDRGLASALQDLFMP